MNFSLYRKQKNDFLEKKSHGLWDMVDLNFTENRKWRARATSIAHTNIAMCVLMSENRNWIELLYSGCGVSVCEWNAHWIFAKKNRMHPMAWWVCVCVYKCVLFIRFFFCSFSRVVQLMRYFRENENARYTTMAWVHCNNEIGWCDCSLNFWFPSQIKK